MSLAVPVYFALAMFIAGRYVEATVLIFAWLGFAAWVDVASTNGHEHVEEVESTETLSSAIGFIAPTADEEDEEEE